MKKADAFQRYAQECRDLAAKMNSPSDRQQLLDMAGVWDELAREREESVARHPEFRVDRD